MQAAFPIDFPEYPFKFKRNRMGRREIFDISRRRYITLTPEEMVRQHLINLLAQELGYPLSLMAVEKGIELNGTKKRCDIVIYDRDGKPVMIVECKAPEVKLSQSTFDQAARYNLQLQVPYLLLCNGYECYCSLVDHQGKSFTFLNTIPAYADL